MEDHSLILDENFAQADAEPQQFVMASHGKRFANYIIDRICWTVLFFLFGLLMAATGSYETVAWMEDINPIMDYFLTAVVATLYYALFEFLANGKTIGKFITRTRVINEYGETPDFGTILGRSLSRFVPFEPFSFLGNQATGWHDKWSNTMVIEDK